MQEENWQSGIQGIVKQGPVKMKTGFGVWKKRWLVFQRATSYGPSRLVVCSKRESFIKHPFGKKNHTVVFMRDVNNVSKGATKHGETKVTIGFNIAKPYMEFICLEVGFEVDGNEKLCGYKRPWTRTTYYWIGNQGLNAEPHWRKCLVMESSLD